MKLFKLVDETADLLNRNYSQYSLVESQVTRYLVDLVSSNENYIGSTSRIKSENSLRNKIIKRKYYLEYETAEEIIDNLSDVIGITLECRFKEDEVKLYNQIIESFEITEDEYSCAKDNNFIFMKLKDKQPQKQTNGFDIFRIDGYYIIGDKKINFELQIKSLINTFWSGIEHEVIYKNNNFLMFDTFLKDLLTSVKSNLDIIDSQLTQIYTEMTHKSNYSIGMDGTNFKSFLAKEINNLFSLKLKETAQIDIDIKKISALLSHYLYLEEFVKSNSPQIVMIDYFEKLDLLSKTDMDFTKRIDIREEISNGDKFQEVFGMYCLYVMNIDFDWHVLFSMLFMLQEDEAVVKFNNFVTFIKHLLFEPSWYKNISEELELVPGCEEIRDGLYTQVASSLIKQNSVSIIYEENLYCVMVLIREFIDTIQKDIEEGMDIHMKDRYKVLDEQICAIFN